jgi:molybdopterin biosynthesis enzyme MoaB
MGAKDHRDSSAKEAVARCAILTVTDSKTRETDTSGKAAFEIFQKYGNSVVAVNVNTGDIAWRSPFGLFR